MPRRPQVPDWDDIKVSAQTGGFPAIPRHLLGSGAAACARCTAVDEELATVRGQLERQQRLVRMTQALLLLAALAWLALSGVMWACIVSAV